MCVCVGVFLSACVGLSWHVVSSAKEGCVLAFSSIDKLREFAPAVPDQATKAMDGAHLFASLSTNVK